MARIFGRRFGQLLGVLAATLFLNEFLIYYLQIYTCSWPDLSRDAADTASTAPIRALILADIHMLGPRHGHWADKLRREWQMHRAFQTALTIHRPDVVFILGDLFDEGQLVSEAEFDEYVRRFRRLFYTPPEISLYGAIGNHDVGFHYRMRRDLLRRFQRTVYTNPANGLIEVGGVNFVVVNSMAMEQDGCTLCRSAEATLRAVGRRLECRALPTEERLARAECVNQTAAHGQQYSAPVLLQHFPTWRRSDATCRDRDDVPLEEYRERWEVLSERASRWLAEVLRPRVVFSGHSHYYCRTETVWGADEWTVNSFSWRNNNNPKFLMATFDAESHAVAVCAMPRETTVLWLYVVAVVVAGWLVIGRRCWARSAGKEGGRGGWRVLR